MKKQKNKIIFLLLHVVIKKYIDLLLLLNSKSSDYVLLQDYNRFVTNKTKYHGKNIFVDIAYNPFLAEGYQNVMKKIVQQLIIQNQFPFLQKINMLILKVSKKLTKAPFKIYSGYECLLICSTDNINFG